MIFDLTKNKKIYDISPLVSPSSMVFPGDRKFSHKVHLDYSKGDKLKLSSFETTCHIGAHADAPIHYHKEGKPIDKQDLNLYLGPCHVIDVSQVGTQRIPLEAIGQEKIDTPRILFKTNSINDFNCWQDDFSSLSTLLIEYLAQQNVKLVGIDTPSIDPSKDDKLLAHNCAYTNNICILENLDLSKIKPGLYNLVALPLKLKNLEASPVRAILLK